MRALSLVRSTIATALGLCLSANVVALLVLQRWVAEIDDRRRP